jgi:hypothetical protein
VTVILLHAVQACSTLNEILSLNRLPQSLFEDKVRQPTRGGVLALSQLIQKTREKLAEADSSAWSEEEKNTARESLTGLMQEVQSTIERL